MTKRHAIRGKADTPRGKAYEDDVTITMRGVGDSIGLPHTVNPVELVDREALIELREGPQGPDGPDGEPAWPWNWQGDIADPAALQALALSTADARKAWRVVSLNAIYYWTGQELIGFANAFNKPGNPGPANRLTGSAAAGPVGSTASARITGTTPAQQLEITFPRGEVGEVGEAGGPGRILEAADVLIPAGQAPGQDQVLTWSAAAGKFVPAPGPRLGGPWVIGSVQFTGGTKLNDPWKTVAAITIPAQPAPWRPIVNGWLMVATEGAAGQSRCDIEVRIGGPDGQLVGLTRGTSSPQVASTVISPWFEQPLSPTSALDVIAANQTATLYVIVRRVVGSARYTISNVNAQLIVTAQTVRPA